MAPSQDFHEQTPFSILDALYCEEEKWEDEEEDESFNNGGKTPFLVQLLLVEQDLLFEDEELLSLFSKEREEKKEGRWKEKQGDLNESCSLRKEAIEWIIKVNSYYGFCTLTCVLAVNYFDRFFTSFHFQKDKPWMFQLVAVTSLSLAAKLEETHVPLLLDLQVEGGKYVFEAKTIQKMELLVLSTLEWKMNPVTPLSFLDCIIRRLGLKNHLHWEFLWRCEQLLLSLLSDWRLVSYVPSVLATATMMHVIDQIEPCNPLDYHNQLLGVLNITKDKVIDCYQLIVEKSSANPNSNAKRTFDEMIMTTNNFPPPPSTTSSTEDVIYPSSPTGVMDTYYLSSDTSNDSWAATPSSSPVIPWKKTRVHEQQPKPLQLQLPSLSRVFVEVVASPR